MSICSRRERWRLDQRLQLLDDHAVDSIAATTALAALGQGTRLSALRLLLLHPGGLAASVVAERLGTPRNSMSNHLSVLASARLVMAERQGKNVIYRADNQRYRELIDFLSDI